MHVELSQPFEKWYSKLRDPIGRSAIRAKIFQLEDTDEITGDIKSLGAGLYEIRIHVGPGYRIYLMFLENKLILLLAGGDKSSQTRDIQRARKIMEDALRG